MNFQALDTEIASYCARLLIHLAHNCVFWPPATFQSLLAQLLETWLMVNVGTEVWSSACKQGTAASYTLVICTHSYLKLWFLFIGEITS